MNKVQNNKSIKIIICALLFATTMAFSLPNKDANAMSVEECTALATGNEYGTTIRNASVIAIINNPSWSTFKKTATNLVKSGVKGNIIAISYSLYNNYNKCVKKLGNQPVA